MKLRKSGGQFLKMEKENYQKKLEKLGDRDEKELPTKLGFTFCKVLRSSVMNTTHFFPFIFQSCCLTMNQLSIAGQKE